MNKILIVDDSSIIRKKVIKIISKDGYETIEAEDGKAAYDLFISEPLDLVITDINMPLVNGIELSRKIRQSSSDRALDLPIIVLSTEFSDEIKKEGKEVGVSAWIVKPCDELKLRNAVKTLLNKS